MLVSSAAQGLGGWEKIYEKYDNLHDWSNGVGFSDFVYTNMYVFIYIQW